MTEMFTWQEKYHNLNTLEKTRIVHIFNSYFYLFIFYVILLGQNHA